VLVDPCLVDAVPLELSGDDAVSLVGYWVSTCWMGSEEDNGCLGPEGLTSCYYLRDTASGVFQQRERAAGTLCPFVLA